MTKQNVIALISCIVLGIGVVPVHAQGGGVAGKVPFDFVVSGKMLPAGEYTITANGHMIQILDAQGKPVALARADYVSDHAVRGNGEIIFHCYGDRCLLAEILSPIKGDGRRLDISQTEAKLAREETGKYFAVFAEQSQR